MRSTIGRLTDEIDVDGAVEVWDAAMGAKWSGRDIWVHGDVTASNLLLRDDRLCGVIDFGCAAVGDPACDLTAAWTMFDGTSRERFMAALPFDQGTWARARGWAPWKAIIAIPGRPRDDPGRTVRDSVGGGRPWASSIRRSLTAARCRDGSPNTGPATSHG